MPDRVVITGASSGIGRALAVHYARLGHPVGVTARRGGLLAELAGEITAAGGVAYAAAADVADRPGVTAAVRELEAKLGGIDVLVASAGVAAPDADPAGAEAMLRVNVLGVAHAFAAALPGMLARGGGHLVAIGSMAGYKGLPGSAGYCASKAAVRVYCEAKRIELAPRRVAVTCVCPGFVDTPMTAGKPHPMPWRVTADAAAARIVRGLRRRPGVLDFPVRMRLLMALTRWLPDGVIRRQVPADAGA